MRGPTSRFGVLLLVAGCAVGTSGRNYAPAKGPAGATVTLELAGQRVLEGELLAVEDSTLLILQQAELVRVGIPLIQRGKALKASFTGETLRAEERERLRLISRYPQGVSATLEARLLEAYGRSEVREVS